MRVLPEWGFGKLVVYGYISDPESATPNDQGFASVVAIGAHLRDNPLRTAPQDTFYWLDGIFIVLIAQLLRPDAVEEGAVVAEMGYGCDAVGGRYSLCMRVSLLFLSPWRSWRSCADTTATNGCPILPMSIVCLTASSLVASTLG